MKRLRKYSIIYASVVTVLCFSNSAVHAHPHNWISLDSEFTLDDNVRLVQIKQTWEFDFYYSLMMHADLMNEYGSEEVGLLATAKDMIKNLESYRYFSSLKLDDASVSMGIPDSYKLSTITREGQLILKLEMSFDIESRPSIESKTLAWQVYDPTYYIAMNHATEDNIKVVGGNATECAKELRFPEPSDELIDYAQSLDKTQKNTDGLGSSFAETAFIKCI